ncbi:nucleotidyl transferase AbiEii/AbiGii toxin family protein [Couchioplanes caeruleus]|uniref:nucleotidyl transferase AbiEii/AbiGii toxin family protein n=1 Tax=Couchioplanes caeruleus TaxID=56438 RepID=UPI00203608E2|nr:nucleotidyl transferase AbiEii/AbiGii toxin family protein [Couchioplanes caeruleus]
MTGRYGSAAALCRALEPRLMQEANDTSTDLARCRRLVVFDRVAARLSADPTAGWILKGGAALEFRLYNRAGATKEMDLAACPDGDPELDAEAVRDLLIDALAHDEDGDGFLFQMSAAVPLRADTAGRSGWRFSIESRLTGKTFATFRIDVVAQGEEISRTERVPLPNALAFAGTPHRDIEPLIAANTSQKRSMR